MKAANDSETKKAMEHLRENGFVPSGFAFDGATVFKLDAADEKRMDEGGPVMKPGEVVAPLGIVVGTGT